MLRLQNYQRLKITGNIFKQLTTTRNIIHDNVNNNDRILMDDFTKEYFKNKIELTSIQKLLLSCGSSIAALIDPYRHDMIACLGETTGHNELLDILNIMKSSTEGTNILNDKPRINTTTVSLDKLRDLPNDTFGYCYVKFLDDNNVTPDSRMNVQFLNDPELAYVMTRYRETHDLVHTVLDMPTHMLGEVTVKWIEAINTKLPMCIGGAIFGAVRLRPKQRKLYVNHYLPWAIEAGKYMKPLLPVYWEKRWEQNIYDLRKELNITLLQLPK